MRQFQLGNDDEQHLFINILSNATVVHLTHIYRLNVTQFCIKEYLKIKNKNKEQGISKQVYMAMKLNHTEEFKVNSR